MVYMQVFSIVDCQDRDLDIGIHIEKESASSNGFRGNLMFRISGVR